MQEFFGVPVVSLQLVDPRFYHLDTALAVLDDHDGRLLPGGVQPGQPRRAARLFPDAVLADRGRRRRARPQRGLRRPPRRPAGGRAGLAAQLRERGYEPVGVDLSELLKAGGSVKCCTMELRR